MRPSEVPPLGIQCLVPLTQRLGMDEESREIVQSDTWGSPFFVVLKRETQGKTCFFVEGHAVVDGGFKRNQRKTTILVL